jgi:hypothetical protein
MSSDEQAGVIVGFVVVGFFTVTAFAYAYFLGMKVAVLEERLAQVRRTCALAHRGQRCGWRHPCEVRTAGGMYGLKPNPLSPGLQVEMNPKLKKGDDDL